MPLCIEVGKDGKEGNRHELPRSGGAPVIKIALAQMTSSDDFDANIAYAHELVANAAAEGAVLLALPEVFSLIAAREHKLACAQPLDGAMVSRFRETAAAHGLMILLGSFHERIDDDPGHVHNTSVLIDAAGAIIAVYRKSRLFNAAVAQQRIRESDTVRAGTALPPLVDTAIGRIGLTICFDLRFSDLYLHLRRRADIVFVPSNFTAPTGTAHWEVLLRARAIEGQFYVAAPAQWGWHNPHYQSFGHTLMVDPWGQVVSRREHGQGLLFADLDAARINAVRRAIPMQGGVDKPKAANV